MDTKHRHELEQNDLLDFVTNFNKWWEKWGTWVLIIVLVAAVVVFGKRFLDARAASRHEAAWSDLANTASPESFASVAKDADEPAVAALAYIHGADLLVQQANRPEPAAATSQPAGQVQSRQQKLDMAASMYRQVVDQKSYAPAYRLNAMLGLATIAEDKADWSGAAALYQQVAKESGEYGAIKAQADARLAMLPRLQEKVTFAVEPTTQPATQPATRPVGK